jgi:hypothetical protein
MSLAKDYHGKGKIQPGPGGFKCSCCNQYHDEKEKTRRANRRIEKQKLRKELSKVDDS